MGGELHQCLSCVVHFSNAHPPILPFTFQTVRQQAHAICFTSFRAGSNAVLAVKYAGADPHPSRGFSACPWKICVAAFASPLFVLFVRRRCGHRWEIFHLSHDVGISVPHASRASLMLWFHLMKKRTHTGRKIFSSYVGPLLMFATREQRGAAEGVTQKEHGNTGKYLVRARRSPPGSLCRPLLICAAFFISAPRPRAGMSSGH